MAGGNSSWIGGVAGSGSAGSGGLGGGVGVRGVTTGVAGGERVTSSAAMLHGGGRRGIAQPPPMRLSTLNSVQARFVRHVAGVSVTLSCGEGLRTFVVAFFSCSISWRERCRGSPQAGASACRCATLWRAFAARCCNAAGMKYSMSSATIGQGDAARLFRTASSWSQCACARLLASSARHRS